MSLRLKAVVALAAVGLGVLATPVRGDVIAESKKFRLIDSIPVGGVAVGGRAVGDTYFVASWQTGLFSFDISNPEQPKQLDHILEVQANENEDMATNGKILLLSQFNRNDALNRLRVVDVSDPTDMQVIATLPGAGGHTLTCLYNCKWAYASSSGATSRGLIIDLRDPKKPKLLDSAWHEAIAGLPAHDVTEVRPGLVVTSSRPMFVLDTTNPARPRVLMKMDDGALHTAHNNIWPRGGNDRFLFSASEAVNNGRCELYDDDDGKTLQVWDTSGWRRGGFTPLGKYTLTNGEGHPPLDLFGVQGCSSHWAQAHPSFNNGGLVAMAAFSHGVRLLDVSSSGRPKEVGYFLKDVQGAIDVEWVTDRILYVVDDGGGVGAFDVIEYTGEL